MSFSTTRTARPNRREEKENLPGENFVRPVFRKSLAPVSEFIEVPAKKKFFFASYVNQTIVQNDIRRPSTRPETTPEARAADLAGLENMVRMVLNNVRGGTHDRPQELPEEAEHPASTPIFWIAKWVDYSDKYGIGKENNFFNQLTKRT